MNNLNWTPWTEDTDTSLLQDRRRNVRTEPIIDGTQLWIDEHERVLVEVIDESPRGIGVVIPADTSFEFGPRVYIDYELERRAATVAYLSRQEDGSCRLGLEWS